MIFRSAAPALRNPGYREEEIGRVIQGGVRSHIGGRALAVMAICTNYYWPNLHEDACT